METKFMKSSLLLGAASLLLMSAVSWAQMTQYQEDQRLNMEAHVGKYTGHAADAKAAYRRFCVGCHGVEGDGQGENAQWLDPQPRNFTLGQFKCRSTPSGTLPTDEDLYNSIGRGFDRSVMPIWNQLTNQDKVDLVAYVKHFSSKWTTEKAGEVFPIPAEPEITA